jgi:hypothetical protein
MINTVNALAFQGGGTFLGKALTSGLSVIRDKCGRGINVRPCVVIVVSDGISTDDAVAPANALAAQLDATIYSVGVGQDARLDAELLQVAQNDRSRVQSVRDFNALIIAERTIADMICDPVRFPTVPPTAPPTVPGDTPFPTPLPTHTPPTLEPTHVPTVIGDTPHPTYSPTHPPTSLAECAMSPEVDLLFVMPDFYTVQSEMEHVNSFVDELVSSYDISASKARVGLAYYSGRGSFRVALAFTSSKASEYDGITEVINAQAFKKIATEENYYRQNGAALEDVFNTMIVPQCGAARTNAPPAPCVVIFLTDGTYGKTEEANTQAWAEKIRNFGATLYTIGVSSPFSTYDGAELKSAGGPSATMAAKADEAARAESAHFFPLGSYDTISEPVTIAHIGGCLCFVLGDANRCGDATPWPTPGPTVFGGTYAPGLGPRTKFEIGRTNTVGTATEDLSWLWWLLALCLLCCCCLFCCIPLLLLLLVLCSKKRTKKAAAVSGGGVPSVLAGLLGCCCAGSGESWALMLCAGLIASCRCFFCCGAPCIGDGCGPPCWTARTRASARAGTGGCYSMTCCVAFAACLAPCRVWWLDFLHWLFCGCCCGKYHGRFPQLQFVWSGCRNASKTCFLGCASCWAWFWFWLCCSWCGCKKQARAYAKHDDASDSHNRFGSGRSFAVRVGKEVGLGRVPSAFEDDGDIDYLAAAMGAPLLAGAPLMLQIFSEDEGIKCTSCARLPRFVLPTHTPSLTRTRSCL